MLNYSELDPQQCDFVEIGAVSELANGARLFVEIDDLALVVFNIGGQLFAIADLCSHDNGALGDGELMHYDVHCPRHGASFDVRSGRALSLPAIEDIPAYPVRIVNGQIEIGLPKNA